jgi:hypothetical protein
MTGGICDDLSLQTASTDVQLPEGHESVMRCASPERRLYDLCRVAERRRQIELAYSDLMPVVPVITTGLSPLPGMRPFIG